MRSPTKKHLHAAIGMMLLLVPGVVLGATNPTTRPGARPGQRPGSAASARIAPARSAAPAHTASVHSASSHSAMSTAHPASSSHGSYATHAASAHVAAPAHSTVAHTTPAESTAAKIPTFVPPPPMASIATLNATGKAIVKRLAARTKILRSTSGYENLEELAKDVAAMGPSRARAVEALRKEDSFEFTMRVPQAVREGIAASGFLNQHDTGASKGSYQPEYRGNSEAAMVGLSRAEYTKVPNAVRPKFGTMRPSARAGLKIAETGNTSWYGEDMFVFKTDAVKDHVTFYPNNSLGNGAGSYYGGAEAEPTQWHQLFHPWSDRMLLASNLDISDTGDVNFRGANPSKFKTRYAGSSFYEIQIWKPLAVTDIERFEFSKEPPNGEFLKMLRKNSVKIFKSGETQEWKGDEPSNSTASKSGAVAAS